MRRHGGRVRRSRNRRKYRRLDGERALRAGHRDPRGIARQGAFGTALPDAAHAPVARGSGLRRPPRTQPAGRYGAVRAHAVGPPDHLASQRSAAAGLGAGHLRASAARPLSARGLRDCVEPAACRGV